MIIRLGRIVEPQRKRAPVIWVRLWIRKCEEGSQYHNLLTEDVPGDIH